MKYRILKYPCSLGITAYCSMHDGIHKPDGKIVARLEYIRGEIEAERVSYGEIAELVDLSDYIAPDDVLLLEWAGVPEGAR